MSLLITSCSQQKNDFEMVMAMIVHDLIKMAQWQLGSEILNPALRSFRWLISESEDPAHEHRELHE